VRAHLNVITAGPGAESKSRDAGGNADASPGKIDPEWPEADALTEIQPHNTSSLEHSTWRRISLASTPAAA
jgi:hypothetical protein